MHPKLLDFLAYQHDLLQQRLWQKNLLGSHALLASHTYAISIMSVCPSVSPSVSVTLVDCDHTVQQKVEIGTRETGR